MSTRKVGFEIEMSGLELEVAVSCVRDTFGGESESINRFATIVKTELGEFRVEIDAELLKGEKLRGALNDLGLERDWVDNIEELVGELAATAVPLEVVTPPIEENAVETLVALQSALREAGALGTDANPIYAFGLHLNPEAKDTSVDGLLAVLRAFLVAYDLLDERSAHSVARAISPFIRPFPDAYVEQVLAEDYSPSLEAFCRDYLEHNPTRNRALDFLPLFRQLELEPIATHPELANGASRPTYHYRLPSSRIDDAGWSILDPWHDWLEIERLANTPAALSALGKAYLEARVTPIFAESKASWIEHLDKEGWFQKNS